MPRARLFVLPLALVLLAVGCHRPLRPSDRALEPYRTDLGPGPLPTLAEHFASELLRLRPEPGGYGVVVRHATWNDPTGGTQSSRQRSLEELAARARRIAPATLEPGLLVARENLTAAIAREQERLELGLDHWRFDPATEPHALAFAVAADLPVSTPLERREFFDAWRGAAYTVKERIANLRHSAALGRVAPRSVIESVIAELDAILGVEPVRSPFLDAAKGGGRWLEVAPAANVAALAAELYGDAREQGRLRKTNRHLQDGEHAARGTRILIPAEDDEFSIEGRGRFLASTLDAIENELYPAFRRYRSMLATELLAKAPSDESSPYAGTAKGRDFYARLVRFHTTLVGERAQPERLHAAARAWSDDLIAEIGELAPEDWETLRAKLTQRREVADEAVIAAALLRAGRATPLPGAPARIATSHIDDDRPWNECHAVRDRLGNVRVAYDLPSWAAEAAAFRAGTPGSTWFRTQRGADPLQLDGSLPEGFVDGWGLYAVELAAESELYSGELDRLGALAMQAAEAGHLLIDTGIHALGWNRAAARTALFERTLLEPREIERTIDRVLADPGRLGAAAAVRTAFAEAGVRADRDLALRLARLRPVRCHALLDDLEAAPPAAEGAIEMLEIVPVAPPWERVLEDLEDASPSAPLEARAPTAGT
ncbi:MAG: DUF885 family protein [Planctomycetota bacterium]